MTDFAARVNAARDDLDTLEANLRRWSEWLYQGEDRRDEGVLVTFRRTDWGLWERPNRAEVWYVSALHDLAAANVALLSVGCVPAVWTAPFLGRPKTHTAPLALPSALLAVRITDAALRHAEDGSGGLSAFERAAAAQACGWVRRAARHGSGRKQRTA